MTVLEALYSVIALLLVLASVVPELRTTSWTIRMLDVPRLQFAVALMIFAGLGLLLPTPPYLLWAAMAGALGLHAAKILPFTPLGKTEMLLAPDAPDQITVLVANVEMDNRERQALSDLIRREDPDIVFLMEIDADWAKAMEPVLADYPVRVNVPKGNFYGLSFATRLDCVTAEARYLVDDDTPSLFARLLSPCGQEFCFVGLHPRPPLPGTDTDERDAQIIYSARFAREENGPVVAAGDFNAAAWGGTSRRFKYVGEYLDPRRGRGLFASFDARSRLLRCPIDQLYVTEEIAVAEFRRGPFIGSDHFPLISKLSLDPETAKRCNRLIKPLGEELRQQVGATVKDYGARLAARDRNDDDK